MEIVCKTEINQTAEKVWAVITDFENCKNYITAIKSLEVIDRPKSTLKGFKWKETRVMFGKEADETMWITDFEENVFYQTRAENHGAIYISKLSIKDLKDKVILTMSFTATAENIFMRMFSYVMGLMMTGMMKKALNQDLADMKKHAEQLD